MPPHLDEHLAATLAAYDQWLAAQPLAPNTRRAYRTQVHAFLTFLITHPLPAADPLADPTAWDWAVRDFKHTLKQTYHARPRTVNLALAALDHFARFLGMRAAHVAREHLPHQAPQGLDAEAQKRLLRIIERDAAPRDQALLLVLFYTGVRISECAALNMADVPRSARKGILLVRSGKGDTFREVPLIAPVRHALDAWEAERRMRFPQTTTPALFLNRRGHRLSIRAIAQVVHQMGQAAGLHLSAHTLRHTWVSRLVRQGTDLVLVADLAGHRRLETTRQYCLPTAQEREAALDRLILEDA